MRSRDREEALVVATRSRARSGRHLRSILLLVTALSMSGPAPLPAQAVSEDSLRSFTRFLAHDSLRGRRPGTRGERLAADYLVDRLRRLGLVSLPGRAGMRLPVPLTVYAFGDGARMELRGANGDRSLRPPAFYHPGGGPRAFRDFGGELLVAGAVPGALATLEGIDLEDRVVLLGPPWEGTGAVEAELFRRGAAGAVEAVLDARIFDRLRVVRGPDRFTLPEEVEDPDSQTRLPRVVVGPSTLEELGVADLLQPGVSPDEPLRPGTEVQVRLDASRHSVTGLNVAALLPGSAPVDEVDAVLYMAHYDHVGVGEPTAGDSIWNGFADNASGVAVLLEVARILAADPPHRPAIFLFTTAEEQGLLGATWFAHEPAIPLDQIAAVINVDGGLPAPGVASWQVAAPDTSAVRRIAARALTQEGWEVRQRPIRSDSDHWAFHRRGVPALFLYPGSLAEGLRVHTADDEWRPDAPFGGLARYARAALAIGRRLSRAATPGEAPRRP